VPASAAPGSPSAAEPSTPASTSPAPAPVSTGTYVEDIESAGISAQPGWIITTGQRLCSAWDNGSATADTDQILLAGGVKPSQLDSFNTITVRDLCPGTRGGPNAP
jgi:hypothetical protein